MDNEENLTNKLYNLEKLGFLIVPFMWGDRIDSDEMKHGIEEIKRYCQEKGFPIDGIVFKYDNIKEYLNEGRTDHHFKGRNCI